MNLYKSTNETLQNYINKRAPVDYGKLVQVQKDVATLEQTLDLVYMNWISSFADEPELFNQLRSYLNSSSQMINTIVNQEPVDPANLAHEIAKMKSLPAVLRDRRLKKILETQFTIISINPDGNCGPRALAHALGNENDHQKIREEVATGMMKRSGQYFSPTEFRNFASKYNRGVGLLSICSTEVVGNRLQPESGFFWGSTQQIMLYYTSTHQDGNLNHYDLLVPIVGA